MACLFMDGFEIDFADKTPGLWDTYSESFSSACLLEYASTYVRSGNGALRQRHTDSANDQYLSKTLPSTYTELYVGFGFRYDSGTALDGYYNATVPFFEFRSSTGDEQVTLGIDESTKVLRVFNGHGNETILGAGSTALTADTWYYIEIHVVIDDSTGSVEVRLNGSTEISLSNVDTNWGGGDIQAIRIGFLPTDFTRSGEGDFWFDDFMVNDTSGSVANDWPASAKIEMLVPDGDGNYSQWTSTGVNDYTEVDDLATYGNLPDGDTTKLSHAVVGERASVTLTNTTIAGAVQALMLLSNVSVDSSGDQMAQSVRLSGADYDQASFSPSTTYDYYTDVLSTNPATSAQWLTSEIDGMELGWKVS